MWLVSLSCLSALGSFCDLPGGRGAFVLDLRCLTQIENRPVALNILQARAQGFEKGGYIVRSKCHGILVILILSYSSVMAACNNIQFHRKHEAH